MTRLKKFAEVLVSTALFLGLAYLCGYALAGWIEPTMGR